MRAEAQCVCGQLFVLDLQRRYGPSSGCGDQSLVWMLLFLQFEVVH